MVALKTQRRVLTAVVLAGLVLAGLYGLPPLGITLVVLVLALVGGLEWGRLLHLRGVGAGAYALLMAGLTGVLLGLPPVAVASGALVWWALVLAELPVFRPQTDEPAYRAAPALAGVATLAPSLALLPGVVERGPLWAVAVLVMVWASDIGAWGAGRLWGRRALIPWISAGKTWEGLIGGVVLAALAGSAWAWPLASSASGAWGAMVGGMVAIIGQVGDLAESMLKRRAGVKDSGGWLPGHGGLLDRIDSLTAVMPVYVLLLVGAGL